MAQGGGVTARLDRGVEHWQGVGQRRPPQVLPAGGVMLLGCFRRYSSAGPGPGSRLEYIIKEYTPPPKPLPTPIPLLPSPPRQPDGGQLIDHGPPVPTQP